ncbi:SDR family NAD(P)-dependent oxidoreductase [Streptomyces halobius]|uniref:SDR family oxidoreductase n=1 Tax=Streptomyces halobius TaxID=2879846 RepID=A0ABY4MLP7_9ACTN|nr:SDR family oxidoreductase [Streptomyces halobius]UQA97346.1 SDR family oxidoreductase [Streptomyces halobius]
MSDTASPPPAPRSVVVTGGGSGIGRATARAFVDEGAAVLVVGRTAGDLADTARGYDTIRTLAVDLTEADAPQKVVDTALRELGGIDVLVNNAAALGHRALADIDPEQVTVQLGTNLAVPVLLTRCALDALAADGGGTVVNVSSSGARGSRAWPGNGVYGAAKAALDFLTRTWAVELAPLGIRTVGVAPGLVDSGFAERAGMSPEQYDGMLHHVGARTPQGRVGTPEEIAWWITHLTRPGAHYLTGAVLPVDGGLSLT